jgi:hypothetical protein
VESLVRSNLVVGLSEALEHALLDAEVGPRRFGGFGFESFVQSHERHSAEDYLG